jgi:hypothetical protein
MVVWRLIIRPDVRDFIWDPHQVGRRTRGAAESRIFDGFTSCDSSVALGTSSALRLPVHDWGCREERHWDDNPAICSSEFRRLFRESSRWPVWWQCLRGIRHCHLSKHLCRILTCNNCPKAVLVEESDCLVIWHFSQVCPSRADRPSRAMNVDCPVSFDRFRKMTIAHFRGFWRVVVRIRRL